MTLFLLPSSAIGEGTPPLSPLEFQENGETYRLAGLLPFPAAPDKASSVISKGDASLNIGISRAELSAQPDDAAKDAAKETPPPRDRYGRFLICHLATATGADARATMVQAGKAIVYSPDDACGDTARLLTLEATARKAGRGGWANQENAVRTPETLSVGRFAIFEGTIRSATKINDRIFLNFGEDWRKDATIVIPKSAWKFFRKAKRDPLTFEGQRIRARGFVIDNYGPQIEITNPALLEWPAGQKPKEAIP